MQRECAIRRGDIVQQGDGEDFFVVVTADCDLNRFWSKNYGHLNLIPAYKLSKNSPKLTANFKLAGLDTANFKAEWFKPNSLTGDLKKFKKGVLILPFVPVDATLCEFLVFPKEIKSVLLPAPPNPEDIPKSSLKYDGIGFKRICTISEPFLTPFIHELLEALAGLGVPDYPEIAKFAIHERSKAALT